MVEPGIGDVVQAGAGAALTLVGQANGAYQLAVLVTEGGAVDAGTCEIAYALDAASPIGPNFWEQAVIPASGLFPIPGAGFSLQFDPTANLVVDTTYEAPALGSRAQQFAAVVQWRLLLQEIGDTWTWRFGAEFLLAQEAPPRVTWVTTDDVYDHLRGPGANPRKRRTRHTGIEVHVWGVLRQDTEVMIDQVQDGLYLAGFGSFKIHKGMWPNQKQASAGPLTNLGQYYVFLVTVEIPVTDGPLLTGTATSAPLTPQLMVGIPPEPAPG